MTPQINNGTVAGSITPGQTPLRDQLSINRDGAVESLVDIQQVELRTHLKVGLQSLPAPKNDFEIVLPETDVITEGNIDGSEKYTVEDASDVDERNTEIKRVDGINITLRRIFDDVCTCPHSLAS